MKITLSKSLNNTFKICYDSDYETAKKIKVNEPYEFEFKNVRNIRFHKKWFSLLNLTLANTDKFKDINHLRRTVAIECGWYNEDIEPLTGEIRITHKSISFSQMDNDQFSELYSKSIDYCCQILGIEKSEIIEEINQFF